MILLIRHGQTAWNAERRIQGQSGAGLNALGERQARAMAGIIAELVRREPGPPWRLMASPLMRTRQTAAAVSEATGLQVEYDPRLAEIGCGAWEGRLRTEVAEVDPHAPMGEWIFSAPGGESFEDVFGRAESFLADLPPEPDRRVVVVSHGIYGRLMRGAYAGLGRAEMLAQDVPQDAVYRLQNGQIDRFDCEPVE